MSGARNLPRASHACQRCREKKTKCNQEHPCSNCIKQAVSCVYGIRRKNARLEGRSSRHRPAETPASPDQHRQTARAGVTRDPASTMPRSIDRASFSIAHSAPRSHGALFPQPPAQIFSAHGNDVLGDVNRHTNGTEFYGTSSNYVLLNQLFSYAQLHTRKEQFGSLAKGPPLSLNPHSDDSSRREDAALPVHNNRAILSNEPLSIVNLLSTQEASLPPSRAKTPLHAVGCTPTSTHTPADEASVSHLETPRPINSHSAAIQPPNGNQSLNETGQMPLHSPSSDHDSVQVLSNMSTMRIRQARRRLEGELIRSFLHNLHYLHPLLDATAFTAQCEEVVWTPKGPDAYPKGKRHFLALYNITIAVGALTASSDTRDELKQDVNSCQQDVPGLPQSSQAGSFPMLSRHYFRKSRAFLGDSFEACSLESAQALFLMSLYCQNALKPHACYMYCGMAVRTALAIGLPTELSSSSAAARKAARRTWWCIYSHEIDMCCSSGRRDSLGKPYNYPIPLPLIKGQHTNGETSNEEEHVVAMISEMVSFAVLLRRISKDMYHNPRGLTIGQKSGVAIGLDADIVAWKLGLPEWLNFEVVNLRESEWAAKQKLVLHIRYLNARLLLHRPFLAERTGGSETMRRQHEDLCLNAARETIDLLYASYRNRHYFRTWWYNSTYALYAGMIVLYVILLGHSTVSSKDLVDDVEKSRDILRSMEEAGVARRSADLMSEVLEMARARTQGDDCVAFDGFQVAPDEFVPRNEVMTDDRDERLTPDSSLHTSDQEAGNFLATLMDPRMLQDFASVGDDPMDLDSIYSYYPMYSQIDRHFDGQGDPFHTAAPDWLNSNISHHSVHR